MDDDAKVHQLLEELPDFATEKADNITEDIKEIIKEFSPSITEIVIALGFKGIGAKRQGRFDDAICYYQEVVNLLPENGGIYYNLGKLFYITGQFEKSRRAYTLSYIFNGPGDTRMFFCHLGHAIEDEEKPMDDPYIATYRDSISGKESLSFKYIPTPEMEKRYSRIGESNINRLIKDYESRF